MEELQLLPTQGVMHNPDVTGDTKIIWDRSKPDEIAAAEAVFDKLTSKGYAAYAVKKDGEKDKQLVKFDPNVEKIIFAPIPRMRGG